MEINTINCIDLSLAFYYEICLFRAISALSLSRVPEYQGCVWLTTEIYPYHPPTPFIIVFSGWSYIYMSNLINVFGFILCFLLWCNEALVN